MCIFQKKKNSIKIKLSMNYRFIIYNLHILRTRYTIIEIKKYSFFNRQFIFNKYYLSLNSAN